MKIWYMLEWFNKKLAESDLDPSGYTTAYFSVYARSSYKDIMIHTNCHEEVIGLTNVPVMVLSDKVIANTASRIPKLQQFFKMLKGYGHNYEACFKAMDNGMIYVEFNELPDYINSGRILMFLKLLRIAWNWEGEPLGQAILRFANERFPAVLEASSGELEYGSMSMIHASDQKSMQRYPAMYTYVIATPTVLIDASFASDSAVIHNYLKVIKCRKNTSPSMVH